MKNKNKKLKDLREDWKDLADDEIMQLNQDIDTLELPEDTLLQIELYINRFKIRLNEAIDKFEVTTEIALQNKGLLSDMLYEVKYDGLNTDDEDTVKDMLEFAGYFVIKAPSLAEQMKVEAFIDEMKVNPYQLTLVA